MDKKKNREGDKELVGIDLNHLMRSTLVLKNKRKKKKKRMGVGEQELKNEIR